MEITTDRPKQSRISLEHWKTREYNDAIRVCTVFGLEFKNLYEEPLRQEDKVDASPLATDFLKISSDKNNQYLRQ